MTLEEVHLEKRTSCMPETNIQAVIESHNEVLIIVIQDLHCSPAMIVVLVTNT